MGELGNEVLREFKHYARNLGENHGFCQKKRMQESDLSGLALLFHNLLQFLYLFSVCFGLNNATTLNYGQIPSMAVFWSIISY